MNDDPSRPEEDPAPTGHAAADPTPTDPPDPAGPPGSGDQANQRKLSMASLRHLDEVAEASRQIAALRPPAVKLTDRTITLGMQANKDLRWTGLFAARQAVAKLQGDLAGISRLSQRLAQTTASGTTWRVAAGRSDQIAQAVVGAVGWRIGPALDFKLSASLTRPWASKVAGGRTLGLLAQSSKGSPYAALFATGQAAARLHRDLVGISEFSTRFAQVVSWRVSLGLGERVAEAIAGAAAWRIGPRLDLNFSAGFTGPLALKVAGGSAQALFGQASKGQGQWAGLLAAALQSSLAIATGRNDRLARTLLGHPLPRQVGLASEASSGQAMSMVRLEAERRAAAYRADAAIPQLLTLMEGQAQVLAGISETIEELLSLARSSQAAQQADATIDRRLQLAVLLATVAALLLSALSYLAPRHAPPPAAPQVPATTVTVPHAGVTTTTASRPEGPRRDLRPPW